MMHNKKIFVIGRPYAELIDFLLTQGYKVGAFVDSDDEYEFPEGVNPIVKINMSNAAGITAEIDALLSNTENFRKPDAVVTSFENYILAKTWIGNYFGLAVPDEESVMAATDKSLMRQKFMEYDPSITPNFREVSNWNDLEEFANQHSFPLILKPTNLFKSLLVSKNNDISELKVNYEHSLEQIQKIYTQEKVKGRTPRFVVEEFLQGTFHSLEAFSNSRGEVQVVADVVDLVMGSEIGVNDNYNYSRILPSKLSREDQERAREVIKKGMSALGLKNSAGHAEFVFTKDGPKIIEIGARIGGYRPRMYKMGKGLDLDAALTDVALGKEADLNATKNDYVAVFEIFPVREGRFSGVENLERLKNLPCLKRLSIKDEIGEMVGLSKDGYRTPLVIIISSADKGEFLRDYEFVRNHAKINVA